MISVADARQRILDSLSPLAPEQVAVADGLGRVLAVPVVARRTQPPKAVSAMDGYAVRAADIPGVPTVLTVVATIAAGTALEQAIGPGQAARIFTGAPLPPGADTIVIQEDTMRDGDRVTVTEAPRAGQYVRAAGLDFRQGDVLLHPGQRLGVRDVALAAGMNHPWLTVHRRPRVAILATGDEIVMPGEPIGPNQIVSSNSIALASAVRCFGGEPILLGVAPDERGALRAMAQGAEGADILVTSGGASVGDHDLVQSVLGEVGLEVDFWKIAMRPGKPLIYGHIGRTAMLGLPGNPVSTLVCSLLFLGPAIAKLSGLADPLPARSFAILGSDLPENDGREDYLRATLDIGPDGTPTATPFDKQDSSMLATLQRAQCLVIRPVRAPAAKAGMRTEILPFPPASMGF